MRVMVTGGAGFIGSAVCRLLAGERDHDVLNVDCLTYAASLASLAPLENRPGYRFLQADVRDHEAIGRAFAEFQPDAVLHLAAESHVDRSITGPAAFISTNIVGTHVMLEAARAYWSALPAARRDAFRFLHISTDEVFGSLGEDGLFTEKTPYDPSSPYSASKAASDHLVRAWHRTYGLPAIVTNCSNNYGPYHFPEKLIPLTILNALEGLHLPVYGDGSNVRDWLFVEDHCSGLDLVLREGEPGGVYNIGAGNERENIDVLRRMLDLLGKPQSLIRFVADRPGHDRRYSIDFSKVRSMGWAPAKPFEERLAETVAWYRDNRWWWEPLKARAAIAR